MASVALPHVQREEVELTEFTSTLTDRTVYLNPCTDQFLLLPGWHPQRLESAANLWRRLIDYPRASSMAVKRDVITLEPVFAATTRDAFADALEDVVGYLRWRAWETSAVLRRIEPVNPHLRFCPAIPARRLSVARAGALFAALWKHGLILCPVAEIADCYLLGLAGFRDCRTTEVFGAMVNELDLAIEALSGPDAQRTIPKLLHLVLATAGTSSFADLDVQALTTLRPVLGRTAIKLHSTHSANLLLDAMHRAHRRACANALPSLAKIPSSYRSVRPESGPRTSRRQSDPAFPWIPLEFPQYSAWQPVASAFIGSISGRIDLTNDTFQLSKALTGLFNYPEVPATPLEMCIASGTGHQLVKRWLESQHNARSEQRGNRRPGRSEGQGVAARLRSVSQFFEFVIGQTAHVNGLPDLRYRNPTIGLKSKRRGRPAQTQRTPLPPWLIREIRDVLFDPDETWARSLEGDYFTHIDPVSGRSSREFSPVRLEFFRLRFVLPIRGIQARLLDSGEGDSERWEADEATPLDGRWVANAGPWAPPSGPRREFGLLRKMYDPDSARFLTGLYISTNKTADRDDFGAPGYDIPWECEEIIALALRLRRWQEQFNPSIGPQKRTVILKGKNRVSKDIEAILPELHWLFRDAARTGHEHRPISSSRVENFWHLLLGHVEDRLAERSRAGDISARPVTLVLERRKTGYPQTVAFDMHTIRVTGLTELHMAGCPMGVLQALAGHATWLMTMYYVKPSAADFAREMGAAKDRALTKIDAATWESMMADDSHAGWHALTVCNDEIALQLAEGQPRELWRRMDYGLCPAGGTLCEIGGEQTGGNSRDGYQYAPVKGGSKNCTSCRFFLTGPAFLGGLNARHSEIQLDVVIAGERLRAAQAARRELLSAAAQANTPESPTRIEAARRRFIRADTAVDDAEATAVTVSLMASSTLLLIRRCKNVIPSAESTSAQSEDVNDSRLPMVAVGTAKDLQLAFTRCTDFELYSRICEDTEVYFGTDATNAALRRAVRFDRVLSESGRPAVFASLSPSECVTVGNLYGRWLRTRLGDADASAVVEGQRTLAELGLLDESDAFLAQHQCGTIVASPAITGDGAQRLLPAVT